MSIASLALLAALTASSAPQDEDGPRVERRSEIRIVTTDGDRDGPGRLDADGDGVVTREEFSAPMGDAFDRLDENDDGRLSTEELAAGRPGPGGPGGPGRRFMMMAGPGGGEHDVRIFTLGPDGPGGHGPMVIQEGGPGVQVFTSRLGPEGGMSMPDGPGPHRVFVRRFGSDGPGAMDANNDGKVSQDEFLAPMIEAFGQMDADDDGFLDEGEPAPPPPPPSAD